jgi:hypothetical protein
MAFPKLTLLDRDTKKETHKWAHICQKKGQRAALHTTLSTVKPLKY